MAEVAGHGGRITDEGIARLRERIGKGFTGRRPWRTEVTRDAAYHMALAIGDLSPLYHDEAYAAGTRWGKLLAPYIMIQTFDTLRSVGSSGLPEGLPGVHSIWTGSLYEWKRPLAVGDRAHRRVLSEGGRRAAEQVRRRPLRLPDVRGGLHRSDRRPDRAAQRHLDPHRAPQDGRDEEVRRDQARALDRRGHRALHGGVRRREPRDRALLGRRPGRRRAAEAPEGAAHADGRDRLRVPARHLPRRQQGRGQPARQASQAVHHQRAGRARASPARALGQRVHHPAARPARRLRPRSRALRMAHPGRHRLDGRRRPPGAPRVPLPQVQLHRATSPGCAAR